MDDESRMIYKKTIKEKNFFEKIADHFVLRRLSKLSKKHVKNGKKQLVVFSFDHVAHRINVDGIFEKEELEAFFEWMQSVGVLFGNSAALDVGANIGNHALYFSDYFEKVYCFEPNQEVYKLLSLNSEQAGNLTCLNIGLSDENKKSYLNVKKTNIGASSVSEYPGNNSQEIELRTLDSLSIKENVKLIKVDVEGHEYQVLSGVKNMILENQPIMLFEQHNSDFFNGESKVVDLLIGYGYKKFATVRRYPYAYKVFGKASGKNLLRSVFPESVKIKLCSKPDPGTYAFVVAIPVWLESKISEG